MEQLAANGLDYATAKMGKRKTRNKLKLNRGPEGAHTGTDLSSGRY